MVDSHVAVPPGAGLGVEVDEAELCRLVRAAALVNDALPTGADFLVVGCGVVVAATAAALAERGARVVLLDKEDGPGREGSGRARVAAASKAGTPPSWPWRPCGLWTEAATEADFGICVRRQSVRADPPGEGATLGCLLAESHAAGLTGVELLKTPTVRELGPPSRPVSSWVVDPVDAQCQAPDLGTAYWASKAQGLGATTAYGFQATRIRTAADRVVGVKTTAGTVAADALVVAAGVWTPYLTRTAGIDIPIMPVVMSELETEPVPPLFTATLRAFGFGARQRPSGRSDRQRRPERRVRHGLSLADVPGLAWWAPRAWSFPKGDTTRPRPPPDRSAGAAPLDRGTRARPGDVARAAGEPSLVDTSLQRLARVVPALEDIGVPRRWGGLVDMTPDGLRVIDANSGPDGLVM